MEGAEGADVCCEPPRLPHEPGSTAAAWWKVAAAAVGRRRVDRLPAVGLAIALLGLLRAALLLTRRISESRAGPSSAVSSAVEHAGTGGGACSGSVPLRGEVTTSTPHLLPAAAAAVAVSAAQVAEILHGPSARHSNWPCKCYMGGPRQNKNV